MEEHVYIELWESFPPLSAYLWNGFLSDETVLAYN